VTEMPSADMMTGFATVLQQRLNLAGVSFLVQPGGPAPMPGDWWESLLLRNPNNGFQRSSPSRRENATVLTSARPSLPMRAYAKISFTFSRIKGPRAGFK
jgi:hypothetical protein